MTEDEIVQKVAEIARLEDLPAPVGPDVIEEVEEAIGFPLPSLLKRLYLEAANGGFGPEEGILGAPGGEWNGDWSDIIDIHNAIQDDEDDTTPPYFVWIYEWGCGIWSLIDCRDPSGPMWAWDPNDGIENAAFSTGMNFTQWMTRALSGILDIPERTV
ncbi:SMI1/KNR4 family protein [Streptomyces anthocyanicus]|uniref:SMI1/KNR4 family protein n=1 Tax=Streptomyces anthocyanicus TaxID=68174 RepID=UPI002DDBFD2D|nr:SMI1/KNR4 family protein [Streptomyces anthocyanicus]WSB66475.1 SMI1/KNR4 family protein [Streptomyces anthocyanicus]